MDSRARVPRWRKTTCHRNCGDVDEVGEFDDRLVWTRQWESKRRAADARLKDASDRRRGS